MPTVLRVGEFRFFFFSNEGTPREPMHVHVRAGGSLGKVWLDPGIRFEEAFGLTPRQQREILRIVGDNVDTLRKAWDEYFRT